MKHNRTRRKRLRWWWFAKKLHYSVRLEILLEPLRIRLGKPINIRTMEQYRHLPERTREKYDNMTEEELSEYNLYRCKNCNEFYPIVVDYANDPENYYMGDSDDIVFNDEKVGLWCQYCEESFYEYGNTILVVDGSDVSKIIENAGIGKDLGAVGYDEKFVELPSHLVSAVQQLSPHYYRTDAWRGYDVFETPHDWVNVRTGWIGWGSSSDFHDKMEGVMTGEYSLHYPVIMVIAKTSNLFSVNVDVYVPSENEKDFERLFSGEEHVDFDSEDEYEVDEVTALAATTVLPFGGKKVTRIGETEDGKVKISVKQKSMDVWKPEVVDEDDGS